MPRQPREVKSNILGICGGIIIVGTLIFIINKEIQLRKIASPVLPAASSQQSPTAIPVPALSTLSFEILNGSGIAGQAQKVADLLKEKSITKITTANADKYTYIKTVIRIKKEFSPLTSEIETMIKSKFELDTTETLDSSASPDIQIIVGK